MALEITDANFEELVINSDMPVLIGLWAEWSAQSKVIGPLVDQLAQEYEGRAFVYKVNVDANPNISAQLGIRNTPTVLFFKDGVVVDQQIGVVPKSLLVMKLDHQLI
ncbi:MAG: thioredoxin family protein [Mucilaginibacter sp.]